MHGSAGEMPVVGEVKCRIAWVFRIWCDINSESRH